jgi:hypothetical protein
MQMNVEVAPAALAGPKNNYPSPSTAPTTSPVVPGGDLDGVNYRDSCLRTPCGPACQGHTDRSSLAQQRLGHARSVCTKLLRLASNYQIRIGRRINEATPPTIASLAAYNVPKDLGRSSAASQPKVRSSCSPAEPPATGMPQGAEPERELLRVRGTEIVEAAPKMRDLQIRPRECGPDSGPLRGFQGSGAPPATRRNLVGCLAG